MPQGYTGRTSGDLVGEIENLRQRLGELEKVTGTSRIGLVGASGAQDGSLPPGGFAGWVPRRTASGGVQWSVDRAGVQPTCWVYLDPAGEFYENGSQIEWSDDIAGFAEGYPPYESRDGVVKSLMPDFTRWGAIYDGGYGVDLIYAGTEVGEEGHVGFGWSNAVPVTFDIYIYPTTDGETFKVSLPLPNNQHTTTPWSHYDISFLNDSSFTTTVRLDSMVGSIYEGTRVMAGTDDGVPTGGDPEFVLQPGEHRQWRVTNEGAWGGSVVAVPSQMAHNGYPNPDGDYSLAEYGDRWYERNVKGTSLCWTFGGGGEAQTLAEVDAPRFFNDTPGHLGISRVRVSTSAGGAPVGSPIIVDVLVDGVSIFDAPLELPDGDTEVLGFPKLFPYPLGYNPAEAWQYENLADVPPGGVVTPVVTSVGSSVPGNSLTIQIWAG